MSWTVTPTQLLVDDQDALTYLAAVEAADGQALESSVRLAVNAFVKGCKADGIWPAIKASCILAGARTLNGALVPLVGAAPTNFNFVSDDYNRKTGLVGDGSTKYLDSNRNSQADPQNNNHVCVRITQQTSIAGSAFGAGVTSTGSTNMHSGGNFIRARSSSFLAGISYTTGLVGIARSSPTSISFIATGVFVASANLASDGSINENFNIFRRGSTSPNSVNARIAFYSIGESLDLALLDARVTTLINAFGTAIP
jgi:hypothetical protein